MTSSLTHEPSPRVPRVLTTQDELRIELPFHLTLESLAYIGVVSQEAWHVLPHNHEHFELCYVAEGRGWFALGSVMHRVCAGDVFLTKPGEAHHGAALGDNPFRLYYLGFHLSGMRSLEAAFYRLHLPRAVHDSNGVIGKAYKQLFDELQAGQPFGAEMVQGLFLQLLVATLRAYAAPAGAALSQQTTLTPAVKRVLDALHARVSVHHDAQALASRAHLSRAQLDRTFKQQLGMTPIAYARSLCLERAKHLLAEGNSVTAVADALGFTSIHSFSIFFKRFAGTSPQTYKRRVRARNTLNEEKR